MRLHVQEAQFEDGKQAARTRANNQHIGFDHFAHVSFFSVEPGGRPHLSSQPGADRKAIIGVRGGEPPATRQWAVRERDFRRWPRERPLASRRDPASGGFSYRLSDNVRFADLDPNQHVNNAVYATYFETGRVTLMKDRSYGLMPDGFAWIMVRLDMHFRAELRWPGTIEMGLGVVKFGRHFRHLRSGGVFRRQMRGFSAIGIGAARRSHAQADAVDAGHPGEFSALDSPRSKSGMTRAAMLAALIVCIAMQPAAAEPFYREDLRIPMEAAGPRGLEAMLLRPSGTRRYPLALISHGTPSRGRARRRCRRIDLASPRIRPPRLCGTGLHAPRLRRFRRPICREQRPVRPARILRSASQSASDLRAAIEAMHAGPMFRPMA